MKLTLAGLGAVVCGLLAAFVVGSFIPRAHVASASITIREPHRSVWRTVSDFPKWVTWAPGAREVVRAQSPEGREMWIVVSRGGRIPMEIIERRAPNRLVTKMADPTLPYAGTWTWEFAGQGQTTTVTLTENGEIYNPLLRFMARFVWGYHGRQKEQLSALADYFHDDAAPSVVDPPTIKS